MEKRKFFHLKRIELMPVSVIKKKLVGAWRLGPRLVFCRVQVDSVDDWPTYVFHPFKWSSVGVIVVLPFFKRLLSRFGNVDNLENVARYRLRQGEFFDVDVVVDVESSH